MQAWGNDSCLHLCTVLSMRGSKKSAASLAFACVWASVNCVLVSALEHVGICLSGCMCKSWDGNVSMIAWACALTNCVLAHVSALKIWVGKGSCFSRRKYKYWDIFGIPTCLGMCACKLCACTCVF